MGVIQSAVNQGIGSIGEAIRDVKLLAKANQLTEGQQKIAQGQQNIVEEQKKVAKNVLYTEEQKRQIRDEQLEKEEKERLIAKIREQVKREREQQFSNERQSTISKIRNLKDFKDHERLRNSPLGGDFNV